MAEQQYIVPTAKGLAKYKETDNHLTKGKRYLIRNELSNRMIEIACDRQLICPMCHGDYTVVGS